MNWETYVQVRHNQLITFDRPEEGFRQPAWRKPPARKGYSGEVTESTRKRIATAVDVMLQKAPTRIIHNPITNKKQKFQLSFITLTISHPDPVQTKEGHQALKIWLQHFKRPWHKRKMSEPIKTYIWKAELQKRGQLHYHITCTSFLHLAEVRRVWNDIQRNRGWLDNYHRQYGKWDANSTDVHSVYRIKDMGRYLTKYIAKQEYKQSPANPEAGFPALAVPVLLDGKVWGCSEDLKGVKRFSAKMDAETWENICIAHGAGALKIKEFERSRFLQGASVNLLSSNHFNEYEKWKISHYSTLPGQGTAATS